MNHSIVTKIALLLLISTHIGTFAMADASEVEHKKMSSHNPHIKSIKHNTTTLSPIEHSTIHNSNRRPMAEIKKKANLVKLAQISEQETINIVRGITDEEPLSIQLVHKSDYIAYKVVTEKSVFTINALDGTVMNKNKNDK